jgi:hypothetical protein
MTAAPTVEAARRSALAAGLDEPPSPRTAELARFLAHAFGDGTRALIHYGSHAQRSDAQPESAHDFFVIVDRYRDAYRSLAERVGTSYRPGTAALLNRVLPPNVIRLRVPGASPPLEAKCAVYSTRHFTRDCSSRARDHFALGRLFQHVQLVWTRDAESRSIAIDALVEARTLTFAWGRAYLPPRFDVQTYCRVLLETSFAAEIRPEGGERIDALLAAQRDTMDRVYAELLGGLAEERILGREGNVYTDPHRPGRWSKFRAAMWFRRSKVRATMRWGKYIALYEDWLEYILHKIARRSGVSVQLTERERRWPVIFLWPKALRFLRSRPQRRS